MRYLTFNQEESRTYKICILVNDIRRDEIERAYIRPYNLDPNEIVVLDLHKVPGKKSTPVKEQKAYLTDELAPVLLDLGVEYLIVGDGDYFKTLTKTTSTPVSISSATVPIRTLCRMYALSSSSSRI